MKIMKSIISKHENNENLKNLRISNEKHKTIKIIEFRTIILKINKKILEFHQKIIEIM